MSGGYLYWNAEFVIREPYVDGHKIENGFQSLDWEESDPLILMPAHASNHIAQRFALDTADSLTRLAIKFTAKLQGTDEEDYFRMMRARAKGSLVEFVPFVWVEEVFTVTAAGDFTLSRPVAWSKVPACNSTIYPARYFVDGTESPTAGSISGQTFSVVETGEVAVRYMPCFYVKVTCRSSIPDVNALDLDFVLEEGVILP